MEICLSRVLKEIRQQQSLLKSNPSASINPMLSTFGFDIDDPYIQRETDDSDGEGIEDLFQFLEDPFDNISLSEYARKIKIKYGDEGFCFIMQVHIRSSHNSSSSTFSNLFS